MSATPLLSVRDLRKTFRRGGSRFAALEGVDLDIVEGETLALIGPSGSGKSTLARVVTRILDADSGALRFAGHDLLAMRGAPLRALRKDLQMVFQDPLAAFNPRATVSRVLDDPLRIHGVASRAERPAAIAALLDRVGLPRELSERRIHEISGGQRQRVAIARAFATRPKLIVLDEALSALDVAVRAGIIDLLADLQREHGTAFLFISHDLAVVRNIADHVAIMDLGRIVESGTPDEVLTAPQSKMGKALIAAAMTLPPRNHDEVPL